MNIQTTFVYVKKIDVQLNTMLKKNGYFNVSVLDVIIKPSLILVDRVISSSKINTSNI